MPTISVVRGTLLDVRRAEMASLCTDGTMAASARELEKADFCCCIIEGRPCIHANKIHKSLDPSAAALDCKQYRRAVTIIEAMSCTNQA